MPGPLAAQPSVAVRPEAGQRPDADPAPPPAASGGEGGEGGPGTPGLAARRPEPAVPAVLAPAAAPGLASGPDPTASGRAGRAAGADPTTGLRVVVSTATLFADGQLADGASVSAGLAREWAVGRGVSVSGGAAAAYTRFSAGDIGGADPVLFSDADAGPVDVTERRTSSTLAVEVPLDVAVQVVTTRRARVGVSVGVTSALYLAQSFRAEGQTFDGQLEPVVAGGPPVDGVPFEARETVGPLGRLDLARQLNLGVRLLGRSGLGVEAYARLPLAGLTSRDVDLTTVGLRLRVPLR